MAITHVLSMTTPDDPTWENQPKHWNSAHAEVRTLSGNTLGASTISGTNLILQGGNNLTLSANGDTLVFVGPSPSGGAFSAGVSTGGNTAGATGLSGTQLVLAGGNNITLSQTTGANGATVTISGANTVAQTVQTLGLYASSNTTGQSSSTTVDARTLSVRGAGGVSVGYSAAELVISGPQTVAQTNQTLGLYASSNTTGQSSSTTVDARTLSVRGAGAASVGYSGGELVVSVPSVVAQTAQTLGIYNSSQTTGQSSSSTYDARSLSIAYSGNISGGWTNGSMLLNVTTAAQTNQTVGLYGVGNTTQNSSTTLDARTISYGGRGDITVGFSNGTVQISGSQSNQQISAFAASNTTQSSSGTFNASSIVYAGAGVASVGISNGSVVISVPAGGGAGDGGVFAGVSTGGNTAGSTGTVSTGNFVLVGSGAITLSQSTGAAGSAATVTFSVPATSSLIGQSGISISTAGSTITVAPVTQSYFAAPNFMFNTTAYTVAASTSIVWPIDIQDVERFDFIRIPQTVSIASMASIATAINTTFSYNQQGTYNFVLYSRGIGASSMSLQSVASTSASSRLSINVQENANGSQWTVTHALSFPASNGTTSFSTSYATTLSNVNISTTHLSAVSGMKFAAFPWSSTLSDQLYWMAHGFSTTQTTQGNASLSNMRITFSNVGMTQPNLTWGEFGSVANNSVQALYGLGSYTTNGVTTASLNISAVSSSASHVIPFITFARIA